MSNPLRDTYDAIWTMWETKSDFTALFPNGTKHQLRYTTDLSYAPDPDLTDLQPADYPIIRLVMAEIKPTIEIDSSGSHMLVRYQAEICTGQQYQSTAMNACWPIFRAAVSWREYLRDAIIWNAQPVIVFAEPEAIKFEDDNKERSRGTKQWICIWSLLVQMEFKTTDLRSL